MAEYGYGLGGFGMLKDRLLEPNEHDRWNRESQVEVAKRLLDDNAGDQLRKRGPHAISPGTGHPRIEIGEVNAGEHGMLRVSVEQSADVVNVHGLKVHLSEIARRDLRAAVVASSAAYSKAISDQEEAEQRAILGAVISAVLRENPTLAAKVKDIKFRERFD